MKNPRNIYTKGEELYLFHGRVFKITDRNSYASVSFSQNENATEPSYISVMCFSNNGGIGVDHKSVAMKAEDIRSKLTGNDILYATIVAVKQISPDGKVNYKARSTSFCVSEKGCYFVGHNPIRVYFKEGQEENIRIMSGFATGVFDNEKYKTISFRADTTDKTLGYVSASCFSPFSDMAKINNYANATTIATMLANGDNVHAVVTCLEKEYNGSKYYNAITTTFAKRKL